MLRTIYRHSNSITRRCKSSHGSSGYLSTEVTKVVQDKKNLQAGPGLADFIAKSSKHDHHHEHKSPHLDAAGLEKAKSSVRRTDYPLRFFIETYGCQMNVSDSEIVASLLTAAGHTLAEDIESSDVILTNTCAIRENAEAKVWHRLKYFQSIRKKNKVGKKKAAQLAALQDKALPPSAPKDDEPLVDVESVTITKTSHGSSSSAANSNPGVTNVEVGAFSIMKRRTAANPSYPIVGVLGCMAERLKEKLLHEESVDFICGPDAYRDIPRLLENIITTTGQKQANTILSYEETYADIHPIRQVNSSSAFLSIMRGCNNMCSFCIVPFTRGRERSRPMASIMSEIKVMYEEHGLKELVLLGQNVNGYHDTSEESAKLFPTSNVYKAAPGFNNLYKSKKRDLPGARFADLLQTVAETFPELRIRFTSPHPKDFPMEVLQVIAGYDNVCKSVHLPVQSGSTTTLERMRRGYSRDAYLELVKQMRSVIPNVSISVDVIAGFCGETEEEHADTLSLMEEIKYDQAFMFAYSLREKTHAARTMEDNVPEETKLRRLREIIDVFHRNIVVKNQQEEYGQLRLVLVEGHSTKSTPEHPSFTGRTDGNKRVVFPVTSAPLLDMSALSFEDVSTSSLEGKSLSQWSLQDLLFSDVKQWSADTIQSLLSRGLGKEHALYQGTDSVEMDKLVGQYAVVRILKADSSTLRGVLLGQTTLQDFSKLVKKC